jgi:O-antigen ligase
VVREGEWPGRSARLLLGAVCCGLGAWALLLSQTRNAWLGALVGLGVVGVLRAPRLLLLLPVGIVALLLLRPGRITTADASSLDRLFMWQAGVDMIKAKPIFGQGPGMILRTYPDYRWPEAPNAQAPHLHDNALQVAAERGLPCLVWWLWLIAAALADCWREARRGESASGAALAVLAAVMAAGLFEYNFGDSEVLMFVLLVIALPYAARRQRDLAPA